MKNPFSLRNTKNTERVKKKQPNLGQFGWVVFSAHRVQPRWVSPKKCMPRNGRIFVSTRQVLAQFFTRFPQSLRIGGPLVSFLRHTRRILCLKARYPSQNEIFSTTRAVLKCCSKTRQIFKWAHKTFF